MDWLPFAFIVSIVVLLGIYEIVKYAVKNGIKEAYSEIKDDKDKVIDALNAIGDIYMKKSENKREWTIS